jgi:hypothetical protein
MWEYSYKRLKLAQLLGQLGVLLTIREVPNGVATHHPETAGGVAVAGGPGSSAAAGVGAMSRPVPAGAVTAVR